ncbi:MAG: extracellular solute-binding protein [Patescibacteria group bacterium]
MNISAILTDSRKLTYIMGGAIGLMVLLAFVFILRNSFSTGGTASATLEVWGVFDDTPAFSDAIKAFEKANKNIKVNYKMFKPQDYEKAVLDALAAGQGPDVWMMHNTWLPKHINKIQPMPASTAGSKTPLMTVRQFKDTFVDVAAADIINGDKIYGLPLYVDTLALYYNKDMFASAGIAQAPKTWTEFMDDVKKITTYDASRNITRSGAAMGTARNINRSTDILMMLMLQSGVQMTDADNVQATFSRSVDGQNVGERTLEFYTDFANKGRGAGDNGKEVYTWDDSMHYSIDAFTAGETAMMINYSHQIPVLRAAASRLNWAIASVPQASTVDSRTYANYWPLVVSLKTKNSDAAWQFAYYMTAGDGTIPYLNAAARPTARRDLINQQKTDPDLGVFAEQALSARSWFQVDNAAIETIFADMIDAVNLGGKTFQDAIRTAEARVSVLMQSR